MTTFTSFNNQSQGKVESNSTQWNDKYTYNKPSNGAGCLLVLVLIAVAIVLFTVVIPALS